MKNIEKIRNMSAEELGEMVANTDACDVCTYDGNSNFCNNIQPHCSEGIAKWLKQEAEKPSIFEPKEGETYWSVCSNGHLIEVKNTNLSADERLIAFGNACTDRSVMERKAHDLKLWSLLWNFAEENNKKMDWEDRYQDRYWLQKEVGVWKVMSLITTTRGLEPYFTSEDIAWRAINEIVLPWERGEL